MESNYRLPWADLAGTDVHKVLKFLHERPDSNFEDVTAAIESDPSVRRRSHYQSLLPNMKEAGMIEVIGTKKTSLNSSADAYRLTSPPLEGAYLAYEAIKRRKVNFAANRPKLWKRLQETMQGLPDLKTMKPPYDQLEAIMLHHFGDAIYEDA